jgi:hypothetical protein
VTAPQIGISVPDVVAIGTPFAIRIVAVDGLGVGAVLQIEEADSGHAIEKRLLPFGTHERIEQVTLAKSGLYRLVVSHEHVGPRVFCLFLAVDVSSED